MIDQAEQRTVVQRQEKDSHNTSFEKNKVTEDDDTLSLESDRSQGFINERAQDWPSWTIEEKQGQKVQGIVRNTEAHKQEDKLGVGIVNEYEMKEVTKSKTKVQKLVPKRFGRGMVRWQKRKEVIKQNTQKNPVYEAKKN